MKKQFIVKTPFGIGVATSEEDLKDMLGFVEGLTQEEEEGIPSEMDPNLEALQNLLENGVVVKPKNVECDCENCQHNARVSNEKLAGLTELLDSINSIDILRFMENDAVIHMNASILGQGKDHPQVAHLEKVVTKIKERIAELGNPAQDKGVADPIRIIIDKLAGALDKDFTSEVAEMNAPETPVEDSPDEAPLPTLEAIKAMTDHDEVDKLQIGLEWELSRLSDKKQVFIDEVHAEMKHIEDLHAAAANQKAVILDKKADIARADMADKVKALQEAITRSQPHLLIHDDIHEAMEILQERYRKQ